jgi:hypothetical protein
VPVPLPLEDPSDPSLVSDESAFTKPWEAAVKATPSTTTAEPPCDTVCVIEASRTTQAPLASFEPVMTLLPIVRTVRCLSTSTRPLGPAVRVAPSNSTAEPPAEAVYVVVMSGMILLPTVIIVVCTFICVTPPGFDWPEPLSEPKLLFEPPLLPGPELPFEPPLLPEPEFPLEPPLFPDPESSCDPPLFPDPEPS